MQTPPDFSALEQAFARQHSEFARLKDVLRGLDAELPLELDDQQLLALAEVCDPPTSCRMPAGLRA